MLLIQMKRVNAILKTLIFIGLFLFSVFLGACLASIKFEPRKSSVALARVAEQPVNFTVERIEVHKRPVQIDAVDLSKVSASDFLIFDTQSREVLLSRSTDKPLVLASLTKLMIAWLTYRNLDLDTVVVDEHPPMLPMPRLGNSGNGLRISDHMQAVLIASANDSAWILGDLLEKKLKRPIEELMNDEAGRLNMRQTHYADATGLSTRNVSTSNDQLRLWEIMSQEVFFELFGKEKQFAITRGQEVINKLRATNGLSLKDNEVFNIKTGYLPNWGENMMSRIVHQGHEIVIIVFKSKDRDADTAILKRSVFDHFIWR